jgi:hypothetical protein
VVAPALLAGEDLAGGDPFEAAHGPHRVGSLRRRGSSGRRREPGVVVDPVPLGRVLVAGHAVADGAEPGCFGNLWVGHCGRRFRAPLLSAIYVESSG